MSGGAELRERGRRCRICLCTEADPCHYLAAYLDGEKHEARCWWAQADLCSRCDHLAEVLDLGGALASLAMAAAAACEEGGHDPECTDCRPERDTALAWQAARYRLIRHRRRRLDGTLRE